MASDKKRKPNRNDVASHMIDIGHRAAIALDRALPSQNRDKIVARMFNVSVRMAQYLRAGQHWTLDRLAQASAILGADFDLLLNLAEDNELHRSEMANIAERLARLEGILYGQVDSALASQSIPATGDPLSSHRRANGGEQPAGRATFSGLGEGLSAPGGPLGSRKGFGQ